MDIPVLPQQNNYPLKIDGFKELKFETFSYDSNDGNIWEALETFFPEGGDNSSS